MTELAAALAALRASLEGCPWSLFTTPANVRSIQEVQ